MLCSELTIVKMTDVGAELSPLPCRRWSCEYCQPKRKRELIAKVIHGKPDTFITLTSSPETADNPVDAARLLVDAWRKVRREACRIYGYKKVPFIAVFERSPSGLPHLHILARVKWIDQDWLSDRMNTLLRAPVCDIRRVRSRKHVANYVAKYVGKQPQQFGTLKRYWAALCYDKRTTEEKEAYKRNRGDFEIWRMDLAGAMEVFKIYGWKAVLTKDTVYMVSRANFGWLPP